MDFSQVYAKNSLSEVVVRYIKDRIMSGQLKSGDKLTEADISKELAVSRAPVREAMRELSIQGIITFQPRKGSQILEMDLDDIMETFDLRYILEIQVLEILIGKCILDKNDFKKLEDLTKQMMDLEEANISLHTKIYTLNSLDIAFHSYLWERSGSPRRFQILEGLYFQLLIAMNQDIITLGTCSIKAREHYRIINALQKNDIQLTLSEFDNHISTYVEAVIKDLYPDSRASVMRTLKNYRLYM